MFLLFPIFVFYFFLKDASRLFLSSEELSRLSSFSLEIVLRRENWIQFFLRLFPWIAVFSFALGISFFVYGLKHWKSIQKEYDAQVCMKTKKDQKELEKMTPTEIVMEKLEETEITVAKKNNYQSRIIKAMQIERKFYEYLKKTLPLYFHIEQHLKMNGNHYDLVATSFKKHYLYEIRYWKEIPDIGKFECCYQEFIRKCVAYEKNISEKVEGFLVIISPASSFEVIKHRCDTLEKRFDFQENRSIQYFSEESL